MLTNETISKLQDMRLGVMARQFKEQLDDPQFASMSFEDRFSILVDAEWSTRKSTVVSFKITCSPVRNTQHHG